MPDCEYKEDVMKLMNSLVNILAIVKHFQNKIKDWLACQGLSTPTEEQVLEVVRKNYDLTLKLQDSLDHYERYNERPKHVQFFTSMVRDVVVDTRKHVYTSIKQVVHTPQQDVMCSPTVPSTRVSTSSSPLIDSTNALGSINSTASTPISSITPVWTNFFFIGKFVSDTNKAHFSGLDYIFKIKQTLSVVTIAQQREALTFASCV